MLDSLNGSVPALQADCHIIQIHGAPVPPYSPIIVLLFFYDKSSFLSCNYQVLLLLASLESIHIQQHEHMIIIIILSIIFIFIFIFIIIVNFTTIIIISSNFIMIFVEPSLRRSPCFH